MEPAFAETLIRLEQRPGATTISSRSLACCHGALEAYIGVDVLGIDRSDHALDVARHQDVSGATFRSLELRDLASVKKTFDGILCLWSSFGYGTPEDNHRLLRDMSGRLREGGRLLLDVYNADAVHRLPELESSVRGGRTVRTRRKLVGRRFSVHVSYSYA